MNSNKYSIFLFFFTIWKVNFADTIFIVIDLQSDLISFDTSKAKKYITTDISMTESSSDEFTCVFQA